MIYHATIPAIRRLVIDRRGRRRKEDLIGCYVKMTRAQIFSRHPRWVRYCAWRDHVRLTIRRAGWPTGLHGADCAIHVAVYWGHGRRGDSVNVLKSIEDVLNGWIWDDDRDVAGSWDYPMIDTEDPRVFVRLEVEDR